ncbi:D-2-hydroxyacid dehydrogenase family protein [Vibrio sp. Of7-15]|uniref:D-2-hydroxyacid dehydrogenase family protein n=1 Tax=Vibrio sp. Of7-15 TaxID=2724879 RepID=UPI001EF19EFB|nr:D-2-hydroxyacid dehydrogenase family protein [Vibrio sp. Of7-15]MCG7495516.1 D-2-hydroxyacid dehydrogenase family protein [Vibrio sp. Of7-15]
MKVAVLDDYQNVVKDLDCFSLLRNHDVKILTQFYDNEDELVAQLKDRDAIVLIRERTQITESLLAQLPNLKLISQTGKVSNHISVEQCSKYNIAVAEGRGSPVAPSELCWALIMASSRHLCAYTQQLQSGVWQDSGSLGLGRTLKGLTLGIWGYGKIGQQIAQFGNAFGMKVLVWGSEQSRRKATADGFFAAMSKYEFFQQSDVLSLHLRLNEVTRSCVKLEDLKVMKPDALFVNISRAELVEPLALEKALVQGRPGFAALDVFEAEPITNSPLFTMPNVLCSPHLGYVEQNSYELYFQIAFENVVNYFDGKLANIANKAELE